MFYSVTYEVKISYFYIILKGEFDITKADESEVVGYAS